MGIFYMTGIIKCSSGCGQIFHRPRRGDGFKVSVLRTTEKVRSTVNSIKLSLDGVTNQFRETVVFGKG